MKVFNIYHISGRIVAQKIFKDESKYLILKNVIFYEIQKYSQFLNH